MASLIEWTAEANAQAAQNQKNAQKQPTTKSWKDNCWKWIYIKYTLEYYTEFEIQTISLKNKSLFIGIYYSIYFWAEWKNFYVSDVPSLW